MPNYAKLCQIQMWQDDSSLLFVFRFLYTGMVLFQAGFTPDCLYKCSPQSRANCSSNEHIVKNKQGLIVSIPEVSQYRKCKVPLRYSTLIPYMYIQNIPIHTVLQQNNNYIHVHVRTNTFPLHLKVFLLAVSKMQWTFLNWK